MADALRNSFTDKPRRSGDNILAMPGGTPGVVNEQHQPEVVEDFGDSSNSGSHSALAHLKHEFNENLALHMDEMDLMIISGKLIEGIDADVQSRSDWEGIASKTIDYLGLKMEPASTELTPDGTVSKVFHTLLLESSVFFWANAYAEMLPAAGPCKVRNDGVQLPPDPNPTAQPTNGQPAQSGQSIPSGPGSPVNEDYLAQAFEQDMNHYLTVVDRQYYRDFSRMLFSLGPIGTQFRKVYWCPLRKRPVSEWVRAENLIVSNEAADLSTAGRITEKIMMRHGMVRRLQYSGWWRDVTLGSPFPTPTPLDAKQGEITGVRVQPTLPADFRHTIYECYAELDLPGYEHEDNKGQTGIPLPYRVTIDRDSKQILEIRRNWREDDPNFCARQRYVMYGMIPGLGFYYLGYGHILGNTNRALTAMERILLDSGQFSSFPGFLYAKGSIKGDTNQVRVPPGGGKEINLGNGNDIRQVVMPLPYKDVSPGLMQLWETIASDGRKLSSITEMPVGEGRADVPVGTVVAMIEQTTKVLSSVHKGLHASQQEELLLLKDLFAEEPSALWEFAKAPARKWEMAEEFADVDLVPASDPNIPSQLHRMMAATALFQIVQETAPLGIWNIHEVLERVLRTINIQNVDALFTNPTPMPQPAPQGQQQNDPAKMAAVQLKAVENQRKAANEAQQARQGMVELQAKMASEAEERRTKLQLAAIQQQTEMAKIKSQQDMKHTDMASQHALKQMDIQSQQQMHQVDTIKDLTDNAVQRSHEANMQSNEPDVGGQDQ